MVVKLEMGDVQDLITGKGVAVKVAYGKFPAHKSAPLLHDRVNRGRGRGLTDFGTCIGQAVVKVRFPCNTWRLEIVPVESGRLAG